jgi:hypothetical protein
MQDWLATFSVALEARLETTSFPPPSPELVDTLLALAKTVADGTGQRTNAPLTCYLAGQMAAELATRGISREAAAAEAAAMAQSLLASEG